MNICELTIDYQATGQLLIAAIVAYVAWQNYKINKVSHKVQKDKLRLDLFDKRLRVFETCQNLFEFVVREGVMNYEVLNKFSLDSSNAEFLFGKEIDFYIKDIKEKSLKLMQIKRRLSLDELTSRQRSEYANELEKLELWFSDQFKNSREFFRKYLHFTIEKDI